MTGVQTCALPIYYNATSGEYVSPQDGSVTFQVYDKEGEKAPANSKVKGLPGVLDQTKVFTTDAEGIIKVPRTDLPDKLPDAQRRGTATVTINGVTETSANNTYVPNRINTRIRLTKVELGGNGGLATYPDASWMTVNYAYEREVDGTWTTYPNTLPPYSIYSDRKSVV